MERWVRIRPGAEAAELLGPDLSLITVIHNHSDMTMGSLTIITTGESEG